MTSGFRYSLLNLGSRYAPNQRVLITNHVAWSRERGDVENRDLALLSNQLYSEWTWHGDVSVSWLPDKPGKNTLDFGGVLVNEVPTFRADQQPYGGLRDSGNTREGPRYAVEEMTEARLVILSL